MSEGRPKAALDATPTKRSTPLTVRAAADSFPIDYLTRVAADGEPECSCCWVVRTWYVGDKQHAEGQSFVCTHRAQRVRRALEAATRSGGGRAR